MKQKLHLRKQILLFCSTKTTSILGFKAWDTNPDSIVQRLSRRDEMDGDFVAVQFDSYFDKRTHQINPL